MFDREDHRLTSYRIGQQDEGNPAFELINEQLDRTITASPAQRIPNAQALLYEVDALIEVIRNGGHAISVHVPQRCIFCAKGAYKIVVNALEANTQAERNKAQSNLGWAAPQPNARWLIMACDQCGNIQTFRPDLPESASSGFTLQKVNGKVERWVKKRNP